MTGYGRAQGVVAGRQVAVEVRCYNHRYKDVRLRLPGGWMALGVQVEKKVRSWLGRGRAECSVRFASGGQGPGRPNLDMENAMQYLQLYRELAKEMWKETGTEETPSLEMVATAEGVVNLDEGLDDDADSWRDLEPVIGSALDGAEKMKDAEGKDLSSEMSSRLDEVDKQLAGIRSQLPGQNEELAERLRERVRDLAGQVDVDENRLAQEVAILAERMDVTEELVRMDSHISQFRNLMQLEKPVGRELDFLLQEMNREINTLSSKSQSAEAIGLAVAVKAEVDKLREQVQNVE